MNSNKQKVAFSLKAEKTIYIKCPYTGESTRLFDEGCEYRVEHINSIPNKYIKNFELTSGSFQEKLPKFRTENLFDKINELIKNNKRFLPFSYWLIKSNFINYGPVICSNYFLNNNFNLNYGSKTLSFNFDEVLFNCFGAIDVEEYNEEIYKQIEDLFVDFTNIYKYSMLNPILNKKFDSRSLIYIPTQLPAEIELIDESKLDKSRYEILKIDNPKFFGK